MFNNIGSKLKGIAYFTAVGSIILSIFAGLGGMGSGDVAAGIITIISGCLGGWISGCVLYGIGQAVENSDKLVKQLPPEEPAIPQYTPAKPKEPWKCVSCGTENEGRVAYCISCGVNRDWSKAQEEKHKK